MKQELEACGCLEMEAMETKHTPGPWTVGGHRTVQSPSGTICETYSHMGIAEADANECLIAAGPEMLEVLNLCEGNISSLLAANHPKVYGEWLNAVRNVIAKATGAA